MLTTVAIGAVAVSRRHGVQHLAGEPQVEQRVDEQRRAVADDQPGVAPAPTAVGLEVGVAAVTEVVQALGVPHAACIPLPGQRYQSSTAARRSSRTSASGWPRAARGMTEASTTRRPVVADHPQREVDDGIVVVGVAHATGPGGVEHVAEVVEGGPLDGGDDPPQPVVLQQPHGESHTGIQRGSVALVGQLLERARPVRPRPACTLPRDRASMRATTTPPVTRSPV